MRLHRLHGANRRKGMTIVESALTLGVFMLLLFGIFEYCRYLMVLHIVNNAARDGARYAAVNVNTSDVTGTQTAIINYTKARMNGILNNIPDVKVAVYPCDSAGLNSSPPVLRSKSTTGAAPYPDPFGATPYSPWNNAQFTERIAVTIKGTYTPSLPSLLFMPKTIPLYITAVTESEG
jgi:Flp pilus assembly protein TadG